MLSELVFTRSSLLGAVAHFVIEQSPYIPDDLSGIIWAFSHYMDSHPFAHSINMGDMVMMDCTEQELHIFVSEAVHAIPEIKILNLSREERRKGFTVEDVDDVKKRGSGYTFISRHDYIKPDFDYVDLGALARNITNFIKWDHQKTLSIGKDIDFSSETDTPANE